MIRHAYYDEDDAQQASAHLTELGIPNCIIRVAVVLSHGVAIPEGMYYELEVNATVDADGWDRR